MLGHVKGNMDIYDEILKSLDKNFNGVVDYTEFLVAAADKEALLSEENLKLAFKMFDTDQSGSISRQELKAVFETTEKKDEELWNVIFSEVDANGDGEINYDEFRESMNRVLTSTVSR